MNRFEKWILNVPPVKFLLNYSKSLVLLGFEGMPLYDVMSFFVLQIKKIGFSSRASGISFNLMMAMPAAMIFLCTLVPYMPKAIAVQTELLSAIADLIRDQRTYHLIANIINDFFQTQRSGLLSFSFVAAVFFSSNAMMGIMHTFDRSYFEERSSRFLAKRWTAIKLTCMLMLIVLVSVVLLSLQGPIQTFFLQKLGWDHPYMRVFFQLLRFVVLVLLNFFTIAMVYRFAPAVRNKWRLTSPGAVLASALTLITTWGFTVWVSNFGSYNKVYGSIGTILILMNLIYINSLVLLIGFEINVSITAIKARSALRQMEEARQAQDMYNGA